MLAVTMFLSFFGMPEGIAQNLSTEGDDFWVGFMENWLQDVNNPIILEIYISADDSTRAHISMPLKESAFQAIDTLVLPDQTVRIVIPTELAMSMSSNVVESRGVHITTDRDVSVYAMNKRQYSADMTVILPTYTLGNDYVVISHWEDGNRNNNANSDAEFLILGIEDNTQLQIVPSYYTKGGNQPGQPFEITLNKGQTYQVKAAGDLTGSTVQAIANSESECKKFAVFAGNMYTKVGECDHPDGHDHLYAQMYPKYTWGNEYITVDFNTRINGDHVKVIAAENNTGIYLNGNLVNTLMKGGYLFLKELDGVNAISGSKPISVAQFSRSQACDNTRGDPFVILINPNQQVLKKITFFAPSIATIENYNLSIVTKTSDVATVVLDNLNISYFFYEVPGNPEYSYAKVSIGAGNHTLTSSEGLIAYVYGYGWNESFGYPTGAGLSNLNLFIEIRDEFGVSVANDSICHDTEVWFKPRALFDFTEFQWNFGDGTILTTDSPDSVPHMYDKPGKYVVELKGNTGSFGCVSGAEQSSVTVVKVLNPETEILGPRSVCPMTEDVLYRARDGDLYTYSWFSEGGGINGATIDDSIHVDWGESNENAWLKIIPVNDKGCVGDTVSKQVKIKIKLEPEAPFGPDSLCSDQIDSLLYETYYVNNSAYDWSIISGQILNGQGNYSVNADWKTHGIGEIWFEQRSTIDSVCAGISDTLTVFVQRKPEPFVRIIGDRNMLGINEPVSLSLETDTLYHVANWVFDSQRKADSVEIDSIPRISYECQGVYDIYAQVLDTMGLCHASVEDSYTVQVDGPNPIIIQVTHENDMEGVLHINWTTTNSDFYNKPYMMIRDDRVIDTLLASELDYQDTNVLSDEEIYRYRIITNQDCETPIATSNHNNILLKLTNTPDENEIAFMEWNSYSGWDASVEAYEIYLDIDSNGFQLIETISTSINDFEFASKDLGFEHCFKVKALESGGNNAYSWSNIQCITFIPELYPYNIITPNNDKLNDFFVIENIEHYPNSVLTIFNRWGNKIYETKGYQNNWGGYKSGNILPNSTYFYVLELNAPRVGRDYINGMISILR
jgi:gliding motility-associated-like protein